ncbi:MAG: MBL fold metallo-hydrolase [Actinobacteria bacterium]|nr:MBL fold metallo-hydrolase [Actinomycetota bacterium]
MEIIPLSDGELRIPATGLLSRDLPPEFTDESGLMPVNFGGFLVRTPDHTVVVDTGIGGGALPELPIGTFPERLRAAGVAPGDVDTVIFTHLHFDHVGWATDGESVFFENATHHAHAIDWAYWVGPDPHPETGPGRDDFGAIPAPERLAPLADSIVLHEDERTEIVPGVTLRHAPGHSPGHCVIDVRQDGERAVILADAAHNPAQLLAADYTCVVDVDPGLARATREQLAEELTDSGALITMTHHGGNRLGRLVSDGRCRRWVPA